MKTSARPELREPVLAMAAKLAAGHKTVPLTDFAALFGAGDDLLDKVRSRGDIVFKETRFSNDGPLLVIPAGKVEIEISDLLCGDWSAGPDGFTMKFPSRDFTVRACIRIAIIRKCFGLREIRATHTDISLDFGNALADRRYTF